MPSPYEVTILEGFDREDLSGAPSPGDFFESHESAYRSVPELLGELTQFCCERELAGRDGNLGFAFALPSLAKMFSSFKLPAFHLPAIALPKIALPKIALPKIALPKLPSLAAMKMPSLSIHTPNFSKMIGQGLNDLVSPLAQTATSTVQSLMQNAMSSMGPQGADPSGVGDPAQAQQGQYAQVDPATQMAQSAQGAYASAYAPASDAGQYPEGSGYGEPVDDAAVINDDSIAQTLQGLHDVLTMRVELDRSTGEMYVVNKAGERIPVGDLGAVGSGVSNLFSAFAPLLNTAAPIVGGMVGGPVGATLAPSILQMLTQAGGGSPARAVAAFTAPVADRALMPSGQVVARSVPMGTPSPTGTHIVQHGDTLYDIAVKNGLTLDQIIALNPQMNGNFMLHTGQVVNVSSRVQPQRQQNYVVPTRPTASIPTQAVNWIDDARDAFKFTTDHLSNLIPGRGAYDTIMNWLDPRTNSLSHSDILSHVTRDKDKDKGSVVNSIFGGMSLTTIALAAGGIYFLIKHFAKEKSSHKWNWRRGYGPRAQTIVVPGLASGPAQRPPGRPFY